MPASKQALLPKQKRVLKQVGERIRQARLRRRLSAEQVAERAPKRSMPEIDEDSN